MIYVKVVDGVVVDRVALPEPMPEDYPDYASWMQNDTAQIGWVYVDSALVPPIYVKIVDDVVVQRATFDGPMPLNWPDYASWVQSNTAQIGWSYAAEEEVFTPPAPTPPPFAPSPLPISDRQFAHALKRTGVITQAEALAFVKTGDIPALLQTAIDAIADQEAREDAELVVSGATEFHRNHPLTLALGAAMGWTEEQMDALWATAATL